jgi:hypothetical protein
MCYSGDIITKNLQLLKREHNVVCYFIYRPNIAGCYKGTGKLSYVIIVVYKFSGLFDAVKELAGYFVKTV